MLDQISHNAQQLPTGETGDPTTGSADELGAGVHGERRRPAPRTVWHFDIVALRSPLKQRLKMLDKFFTTCIGKKLLFILGNLCFKLSQSIIQHQELLGNS